MQKLGVEESTGHFFDSVTDRVRVCRYCGERRTPMHGPNMWPCEKAPSKYEDQVAELAAERDRLRVTLNLIGYHLAISNEQSEQMAKVARNALELIRQ